MIMSLHEIDLAEKIADKIICVRGDHRFLIAGHRRKSFEEETDPGARMSIDNGFFDPLFRQH